MRSGWVALGVLVTVAIITLCLRWYELSTLAVNHQAIRGWLDGDGLYTYRDPGTQTGTTLPPALAILLTPLALLPLHGAGWLLALAGTAALLLVALIVAGPVARRHGQRRTPFVLGVAALALLAEPVRAVIGLGRPELLIVALVAVDLVALRRAARIRHRALAGIPALRRLPISRRWSRPGTSHPGAAHQGTSRPGITRPRPGPFRRIWTGGSWAGLGTGLAVTFSATSLLFVIYLVITRQRRAAGTALATAAAVILAALLVAPAETLAWYGTTMWELDRPAPISDPGNQSLAGVMARLYGFPAPPVLVWFSFGILLLAVGLIRARSAHTEGDEVAAFTLVGLTVAVTGPASTAAESLWMLPAVLILADTGLRRHRSARLPRQARLAGTWYLVAAAFGYLTVVATPAWSLVWNVPAATMILLVNILPSRHASPPLATTSPTRRRAAIPLPRGG
ncbi:glycosyltransferase family 87 protein [Actinoplanes derwentensis]|uniref:glycosyltransferase family 87 protein n=1 Tax=Actinoplanes derwentensis TaxID=113562 RepID=UPI001E4C6EFB|nr:glycosyltransferase family 87 protein [Actinoplanes derwentensis]